MHHGVAGGGGGSSTLRLGTVVLLRPEHKRRLREDDPRVGRVAELTQADGGRRGALLQATEVAIGRRVLEHEAVAEVEHSLGCHNAPDWAHTTIADGNSS